MKIYSDRKREIIKKIITGVFIASFFIVSFNEANALWTTDGGNTLSTSASGGEYYNNSNGNGNNGYYQSTNPTFTVTTYSVESVGENYGVMRGYINYSGSDNVSCWFEWSTNNSYLNNVSGRTNYGSGSSNCSYSAQGLSPNTTYYYRAVAQNLRGNTVYGNTLSFRTNGLSAVNSTSRVETNSANAVAYSSARLNGEVFTNSGSATQVWFEWGATTSLGNSTDKRYVASNTSSDFTSRIVGLNSNTTYYYRAVAENSYGVSRGDTVTFRTLAIPSTSGSGSERDSDRSSLRSASGNSDTVSGVTSTPEKEETEVSSASTTDNVRSGMASVIFGADGFLPDSLLEWLLLFASIFGIVYFLKGILGCGKDDKEKK